MNWDIQLARSLRTFRGPLPPTIKTLGEAIDMIDEHLPEILRFQAGWREAKELLITAAEIRTWQAVEAATARLEHALQAEGWLCNPNS